MTDRDSRLDAHFARCATLVAAIGCSCLPTMASVHWSGQVNIAIPSTIDGVYLNVVTGQSGPFGSQVPGWTFNFWGTQSLSAFINPKSNSTQHIVRAGGGAIANLPSGSIIGPATSFGGWSNANLDAQTTGSQPFNLNNYNYYGFRFMHQGAWHYGRVRIQLGNGLGAQPRSIVEYAWEDQPDMPINTFIEPLGTCCAASGCSWADALVVRDVSRSLAGRINDVRAESMSSILRSGHFTIAQRRGCRHQRSCARDHRVGALPAVALHRPHQFFRRNRH